MTFSVICGSGGLCDVGNDVYLGEERSMSANYLLGSMFTLDEAGYVEYLNVIGGPSADATASEAQIALYTDDGNRDAANLVTSTAIFTLVTGENQHPVESSVWLEAGDYWILGVYSSIGYVGGTNDGDDVEYISHSFGNDLPTEINNVSVYCCRTFNYYMTVTCPQLFGDQDDWYVATTGSDGSGNGTQESPFATCLLYTSPSPRD